MKNLPLIVLILITALSSLACALPADDADVTGPATTRPPVTMPTTTLVPTTTLAPVPSHLEGCWTEVRALVIDAGAGAFPSIDDATVGRRLDNACGEVEVPEFEGLLRRVATTLTRGCRDLNTLYFALPLDHWAESPMDRASYWCI